MLIISQSSMFIPLTVDSKQQYAKFFIPTSIEIIFTIYYIVIYETLNINSIIVYHKLIRVFLHID